MGLFHAYVDDIVDPEVGEYYEVTRANGGVTTLERVTGRRALQALLDRMDHERREQLKKEAAS